MSGRIRHVYRTFSTASFMEWLKIVWNPHKKPFSFLAYRQFLLIATNCSDVNKRHNRLLKFVCLPIFSVFRIAQQKA